MSYIPQEIFKKIMSYNLQPVNKIIFTETERALFKKYIDNIVENYKVEGEDEDEEDERPIPCVYVDEEDDDDEPIIAIKK